MSLMMVRDPGGFGSGELASEGSAKNAVMNKELQRGRRGSISPKTAVGRAAVAMVPAAVGATMVDIAEVDLHPVAIVLGEAWAHEIAHSLRSVEREIIGGWPGTMREARNRVRIAIRTKLDLQVIDELARLTYRAARRGWHAVSAPDSEP